LYNFTFETGECFSSELNTNFSQYRDAQTASQYRTEIIITNVLWWRLRTQRTKCRTMNSVYVWPLYHPNDQWLCSCRLACFNWNLLRQLEWYCFNRPGALSNAKTTELQHLRWHFGEQSQTNYIMKSNHTNLLLLPFLSAATAAGLLFCSDSAKKQQRKWRRREHCNNRRWHNWRIYWVTVSCPTRHKNGHLRDVLPSRSLGLVMKNKQI